MAAPIDDARYFSTKLLDRYTLPSRESLVSFAADVTEHCSSQASDDDSSSERHNLGSLYGDALGPQVYVRLQWAIRRETSFDKRKNNLALAKKYAEESLEYTLASSSAKRRVALLESRWVGSMTMLIAIESRMENMENQRDQVCQQLLRRLTRNCQGLPSQECEVLYGRAGAIQAILWLRGELQLPSMGRSFCLDMAEHVLQVGIDNASAAPQLQLPLVWYWYDKIYLGAAHGIVGILQTLLQLESKELIELERRVPNALQIMEQTIDALCQFYCFDESGNLMSSVGNNNKKDRLVHWCHGAPGWILLLILASKVLSKPSNLELAKITAVQTLWNRGLLKKGLGLCHGIAGNGFVLLRLSHALEGDEQNLWYHRALQYASFGMAHYDRLKEIPDQPFSLYEGLSGFVCFLLACADHNDSRSSQFPLYEFW
ncbi:unnamed protein product [Cylindrotheca closterium]|uniref:Uncharacterized protein n=1 Tax=Cylindrotheca closterium TaxID=2856 RepID=A0AAD2CE99_9STRA|nr:unnamed protein product [Cylindrotheca closterium]